MKILIVGVGAHPGWTAGEGTQAHMMTRGLKARGHDVHLAGKRRADHRRAATSATGLDMDPLTVALYLREIRRLRPDVVLGFFDYDSSHARACYLAGVPLVMAVQEYWPTCANWIDYIDGEGSCFTPSYEKCTAHLRTMNMSPLRARGTYLGMAQRGVAIGRSEVLIAPSEFVKEKLQKLLLPTCPEVQVVFNGVEPRPFVPVPNGPARVYSPTGGTREYKGYQDMVDVAGTLRSRATFVIPGAPSSPAVVGLPRLTRDEGYAEMEKATFGIMPVRWDDPCPLACLEMQMAGRAMVVSDAGGMPEIVLDGRTGLVVPRADVPALTAAVQRLLDDPALARRMGEASRELAESRFSAKIVVDAYERILQRVVESKPSRVAAAA